MHNQEAALKMNSTYSLLDLLFFAAKSTLLFHK